MNKAIKLISSLSLLTILSIPTHKLQSAGEGLDLVKELNDATTNYDVKSFKTKKEAVRASTNEVSVSEVKIQQKKADDGTYTIRLLAGISDYKLASKAAFDVSFSTGAKTYSASLETTKTYSSIKVGEITHVPTMLFGSELPYLLAVNINGLTETHINYQFIASCKLTNGETVVGESAKRVAFKPATIIKEDNLANHDDLSGIEGAIGKEEGNGEGFAGEEAASIKYPNKITYWNTRAEWSNGAGNMKIRSSSYNYDNGHNYSISFEGTPTLFWAVQIFARLPNLNAYGYDKLTMYVTIDSSVDGTITLNGFPVDVIKGKNIISSKLTENGFKMADRAHFVVQFGVDGRPDTYMKEGEFTFSNIRVFKDSNLSEFKQEKINILNGYLKPASYSEDNYVLIQKYVAEGIARINAAISGSEVDIAFSEAKSEIEAIELLQPLSKPLLLDLNWNGGVNAYAQNFFSLRFKSSQTDLANFTSANFTKVKFYRNVNNNALATARTQRCDRTEGLNTYIAHFQVEGLGEMNSNSYAQLYAELEIQINGETYSGIYNIEIVNGVKKVEQIPSLPYQTCIEANKGFYACITRVDGSIEYKLLQWNKDLDDGRKQYVITLDVQAGDKISFYNSDLFQGWTINNFEGKSSFVDGVCQERGNYTLYVKIGNSNDAIWPQKN